MKDITDALVEIVEKPLNEGGPTGFRTKEGTHVRIISQFRPRSFVSDSDDSVMIIGEVERRILEEGIGANGYLIRTNSGSASNPHPRTNGMKVYYTPLTYVEFHGDPPTLI